MANVTNTSAHGSVDTEVYSKGQKKKLHYFLSKHRNEAVYFLARRVGRQHIHL